MSDRMPTRRCTGANISCQEVSNIFSSGQHAHLSLIPENIWKSIPSMQKITCEFILKGKQFAPKLSPQQNLQQMKDNIKIQYGEIMKIIGQPIQPDNVLDNHEQKQNEERQNQIKSFETPRKKLCKTQNKTCQVSDSEYYSKYNDNYNDNIFIDQQVIQRLEDYLAFD